MTRLGWVCSWMRAAGWAAAAAKAIRMRRKRTLEYVPFTEQTCNGGILGYETGGGIGPCGRGAQGAGDGAVAQGRARGCGPGNLHHGPGGLSGLREVGGAGGARRA